MALGYAYGPGNVNISLFTALVAICLIQDGTGLLRHASDELCLSDCTQFYKDVCSADPGDPGSRLGLTLFLMPLVVVAVPRPARKAGFALASRRCEKRNVSARNRADRTVCVA